MVGKTESPEVLTDVNEEDIVGRWKRGNHHSMVVEILETLLLAVF